jgi:ABC-type uncharacterized transport system auxiliary subunit
MLSSEILRLTTEQVRANNMIKKSLTILFAVFLISGCMPGWKTTPMIEYYTLEYPVLRFENLSKIDSGIRIEKFHVSKEFQGNEMVYRPKPYVRGSYHYHRWNSKPADMLTESISRDIGNAKIFGTVLSYENSGEARFLLEGRVEEFMEIDEGEKSQASFVIHVTFSDLSEKSQKSRIILEKSYTLLEPFGQDRHAQELAKAMSAAVEKFSRELMLDIYKAAKAAG